MKRYKNIYYANLNYTNLYNSYMICKRNKRYRYDVIIYSFKYEQHLKYTLYLLERLKYVFSKYNQFYVVEPKKRRILAAKFCDRIVHTFLVKYILEPIFVVKYINTSYACIKNRGMHKCCKDLQNSLKKYNTCYVLKFDISKYFDNIDKRILTNIISKKISDKYVLWLIDLVLNSSNEYYTDCNIGIPIR